MTNEMVKLQLYLPVLSATKTVTWKYHVDDSTAGRYNMIISRYLLTKLGIDLKFSTNTIQCSKGSYQGCTTPMVNLDYYDFEPINIKMCTFLEGSLLNAYVKKFRESEPLCTANNRLRTTLDANYENAD